MFLALSFDLVLISGVLKSLPSVVSLLSTMKDDSGAILFLIIFRANSMLLLIFLPWLNLYESMLLFLESF